MLAIASHFPSTTHLKWSLVTFGILSVGAVLIMQQAQVSQLRDELKTSRNEVTLVRSSEAQTNDGKTATTAKQVKSTQAGASETSMSREQSLVAESNQQSIAQKPSSATTTEPEHPADCDCPIHAPTSIVSTPVQQPAPATTTSQQSQPQQSSDGLVPSLLNGVGGLVGGLL